MDAVGRGDVYLNRLKGKIMTEERRGCSLKMEIIHAHVSSCGSRRRPGAPGETPNRPDGASSVFLCMSCTFLPGRTPAFRRPEL